KAEAGSIARWSGANGLHNPHVTALAQERDGTLWVGTLTGLSRFNGSKFTNYTMRDGLLANQIRALALDKSGALWIGTLEGGLNRLQEGRFSAFTNGLPHTSVRALLADADGSLWIGTGRGLCLLRDNRFTRFDGTESLTEAAIMVILDDE